MSSSMKDALLKAGLISKETVRREEIEKKGADQKGVHEHHMNTFCSQCNKTSEDVEYYEHTNRNLKSKWLCVSCADKNWIHDDTRQTQQSLLSRTNRFQRFYGPTKKFPPGTGLSAPKAGQNRAHQNMNDNRGNAGRDNSNPQYSQARNQGQRKTGGGNANGNTRPPAPYKKK